MAGGRHRHAVGHEPFEGDVGHPLACDPFVCQHGQSPRLELPPYPAEQDIHLPHTCSPERHILVSQPCPLSGTDRLSPLSSRLAVQPDENSNFGAP